METEELPLAKLFFKKNKRISFTPPLKTQFQFLQFYSNYQ